jgi:signal transduction histidine kinase
MKVYRYRQLFLFLAVLILPSILIAVLGWSLYSKEEEQRNKSLKEIPKQRAADVGQIILTKLEQIKNSEVANQSAVFAAQARFSDPAVVAVGRIEGKKLVWFWESESSAGRIDESGPEFARALRDAKIAENEKGSFSEIADEYRHADQMARNDGQHAESKIGLARNLSREGQKQAAVAKYLEVLKLPSTVTDDGGISYWSYVASALVESGEASAVLDRLNQDLDSPMTFSSLQLYSFRDILDEWKGSSEPAIHQRIASARDRLSIRLADLDEAKSLQTANLELSSTNWIPYEKPELWLVGLSPGNENTKPLVLVVRWESLHRAVESDWQKLHPGSKIQIAKAGEGDKLSDNLPGLRVSFPAGVPDEAQNLTSRRYSFLALAFALVVLLTFLGGYLLWRDVRRETHIAELRTQFVSSVSHELKTPLTSIRMFAELLQMRETNDAQQSGFLDTIVSESERLTRLMNNVLDFSRIEQNQRNYRLQSASLCEILQAAARTLQYQLAQQGFVLELNVSGDIPPMDVDRDAIQQAVLNLLANAMKYSSDRREIGLRLFEEDGFARIQVSDRGIGIPEQELSRIFEKFYRVPTPENLEISGTGLGLALVAHIVEAHGGRIEVQSRIGEGSTFSICLPLKAGVAA